MKHVTVAKESDHYLGWPANHGAWKRDNEFLVGFMRGPYAPDDFGLHAIARPYEKLQARSIDGGETWTVERPGVDFSGHPVLGLDEMPPWHAWTICRVCGNYDTGGDDCPQQGSYYLSHDFGRTWKGPFPFLGLDAVFGGSNHCTARTRVLGDRIFLTVANRHIWGTDWCFEAKITANGFVFNFAQDTILRDVYRAVMPAVAEIGTKTFVALRRKGRGYNWIDIVFKDASEPDRGWQRVLTDNEIGGIAQTGQHNGNPPALAAVDGVLYLAYANRSRRTVEVMRSADGGRTWPVHDVIRSGQNNDIGYPQLFTRLDGRLVCVYYFSEREGQPQYIEAAIFDPV